MSENDGLHAFLRKILEMSVEKVPRVEIKADDPRLDRHAQEWITDMLTTNTLPGAYRAGDIDGLFCEKIMIPLIGLLFLAGDADETREEFAHIALRAVCLAFAQYLEHVVKPEHLNDVSRAYTMEFSFELTNMIEVCQRIRAGGKRGTTVAMPE